MRKASIILAIVIIIGTLASCSTDNDVHVTPKVTPNQTNEPVKSEMPSEPETRNWSCEATIRENEDGTLEVDYVITESDGGSTHSFIDKPNFDKSWYEMYKEAGGELFELTDYNFDGYPDIRTQQYGAMVNQYYNIRVWNENTDEFILNQDYMGMANPLVNTEKKQIFTTNYDRGLGNHILFEVKDNAPVKIAEITVKFNNDGTFGYTETIGEGESKTITSESELDSIWDGYTVNIL